MRTIIDQLNRKIMLDQVPRRIVSLVPSQTELLVDLGLKEALVGITKFCVHPENLRKEKKVVGGTKKVHPEKIRNLEPDIILCNKEENTHEMVLELEKIAPVHVSDVKTVGESLEMIGQYGELFGVEEEASGIKEKIQSARKGFNETMKKTAVRKVVYLIWRKPWMAAGGDTFIDHLLKLNNLENVLADQESRYPVTDLETIKKKGAEIVLLSTEPFPFGQKHREELQEIFNDSEVTVVDGEFFSWYGSRLIKAFEYFEEFQLYLRSS